MRKITFNKDDSTITSEYPVDPEFPASAHLDLDFSLQDQVERTVKTVEGAQDLAALSILRFKKNKEVRPEILLQCANLVCLQLEPWNLWNSPAKRKDLLTFMFDWAMETCPPAHHGKLAEGFDKLWSDPEADAIEADVAGTPSDKANDPG